MVGSRGFAHRTNGDITRLFPANSLFFVHVRAKDLAKARLLMPLKIMEIHKQVEELRCDLHQFVQVLKEALVPRENHSVSLNGERCIS
jgi:hypothetical protein